MRRILLVLPALCFFLAACDSKPARPSSPASAKPDASVPGPSGASTAVPLTQAVLTIPAGALGGAAEVKIAEKDAKAYPGAVVAGKVWDIRVNGREHTEFLRPAGIRVPYDPARVPAGMFVTLSVWKEGKWEAVPGAVADAATNSIAAPVWHLSEYAPTVTDADVRIVARWYGTYMMQATRFRHPVGPPNYDITDFTTVRTAKVVAREEVLTLGDWGEMRRFVVESVTIAYSTSGCNADVRGKIYKYREPFSVSHTLSERELQKPMWEGLHERIVAQRLEAERFKAEADALEAALPQAADRSTAEEKLKRAREDQVTAQRSVRSLEFNSYASECEFNAGSGDGKVWASSHIQHPSFTFEETIWNLEGKLFELPSGQGTPEVHKDVLVASLGATGAEGSLIREERSGETWSEATTFVRAVMDGSDEPRELVVKGEVLHRLLVAGAEAETGRIADVPGQDWGSIGPRVIPAAGSVKLEAFLVDTRHPVEEVPVATATTGADGAFELRVTGKPEQSLRIVATWENVDAQLKEQASLEFPLCLPFLIGEAQAGVGPLMRLPAVSRQAWVFARFADAPTMFDLGSSLHGGVLTSEGERKIEVSFKGADAILLGTFVRRATHLNQNHNTLKVKVRARLDEISALCPDPKPADVKARLTAAAIGEDGLMEVEFKGADVCFLASTLMALDALGIETIALDANGHTDQLRQLAQDSYDKSDARRNIADPNTRVAWDAPNTASDWPFVDYDASTDNMDWLLSIRTWRPWQLTAHVKASLEAIHDGLEVTEVTSGNVNVFAEAGWPALYRHLGSGGIPVISISHGATGGHLLALLGVILNNQGKPVRWIVNDPYGDLSWHPDQNGYYGAMRNIDLEGHRGAYAPYGNSPNITQAKNSGIASKYYIVLRKTGANPAPAELRGKLLPGSAR